MKKLVGNYDMEGVVANEKSILLSEYQFKINRKDFAGLDVSHYPERMDYSVPFWKEADFSGGEIIVVRAWIPEGKEVTAFWDNPYDINVLSSGNTEITYTEEFPKPEWVVPPDTQMYFAQDGCAYPYYDPDNGLGYYQMLLLISIGELDMKLDNVLHYEYHFAHAGWMPELMEECLKELNAQEETLDFLVKEIDQEESLGLGSGLYLVKALWAFKGDSVEEQEFSLELELKLRTKVLDYPITGAGWAQLYEPDDMEAVVTELQENSPLTPETLRAFGFKEVINDRQIGCREWLLQVSNHYTDDERLINRDGTWFSGCGTYNFLESDEVIVSTMCRGNYVCNGAATVKELKDLYRVLAKKELTLT